MNTAAAVVIGYISSMKPFALGENAFAWQRALSAQYDTVTLLDVAHVTYKGYGWYGGRAADVVDTPVQVPSSAALVVVCVTNDLFPLIANDFTDAFWSLLANSDQNILFAPWELKQCSRSVRDLYRRFARLHGTKSKWTVAAVSSFASHVYETLMPDAPRFTCALPPSDVDALLDAPLSPIDNDAPLRAAFVMDFCSDCERKNPTAAAEAALEAGCEFRLKTSNFDKMSEAFRSSWREWWDQLPQNRVEWTDAHWSRERLVQWLREYCDVYVSLHRSEGFGYTIFEAMALGKPCVATRYGGNTDFMNDDVSILVSYKERPVGRSAAGCYRFPGAQWAEPKQQEAVEALRRLNDNRQLTQQLGARAREYMRRSHQTIFEVMLQ